MTRPRLAILLAIERSGTHLLRSIVNANKAGFAIDEVANPSAAKAEEPLQFFAFQKVYRAGFPDRLVPTTENMRHLLHCYFDNLEMLVPAAAARPLVIDVKYGHVVNFAAGWWLPFLRPTLFDVAAARGALVIHLVRRKVFQTAISGAYANQTRLWKLKSETKRPAERITLSRDALIDHARTIREAVLLARRWTRAGPRIDMHYEELLDPASPSWCAYAGASGQPVTRIETPFVKAIPSYAEAIANHDEIADLLDIDIDGPFWDQPR